VRLSVVVLRDCAGFGEGVLTVLRVGVSVFVGVRRVGDGDLGEDAAGFGDGERMMRFGEVERDGWDGRGGGVARMVRVGGYERRVVE